MDALAGDRATAMLLLGFSSSTILTPTRSPRAKTPGIHSWMGLLGSPRTWLYHRHLLQLYLPFYSGKFSWYFLFQLTPVSVLWCSVTKTSRKPGRQRIFYPSLPKFYYLGVNVAPKFNMYPFRLPVLKYCLYLHTIQKSNSSITLLVTDLKAIILFFLPYSKQ